MHWNRKSVTSIFSSAVGEKQHKIYTMELVRKKDQLPRFRFEQFRVCEKKYQQEEEKKVCWKNMDSLREFVSSLEDKSAHIVGHIDSETAKNWLDWNLGELFVVGRDGDFCFCFEGGTIVPRL